MSTKIAEFNGNVKNILRTVAALGVFTVLFTMMATPLHAQLLRSVSTEVGGLPAGLNVGMKISVHRCVNGLENLLRLGVLPLTEHTTTGYEPAPNGGLRVVVHTTYTGSTNFTVPNSNNCFDGSPADSMVFSYQIAGSDGSDDGQPPLRTTGGFDGVRSSPTSFVQNVTLEGRTFLITENGVTPSTASKGILHRWNVEYRDPFDGSSVGQPSLDFTQLVQTPGGLLVSSRAKMWLNDSDQLCLRVSGSTQCRARSLGGTLVNGNVTLNVGNTFVNPENDLLRVTWAFRLETGFAVGNYNVVATANDVDPFEYIVDGQPAALDLLPWKSLTLPVSVIN